MQPRERASCFTCRVGYYVSLVQVLLRMCIPAAAHLLVCCPSVGGTLPALVQVIARLQKQAKQFLVIMESTSAGAFYQPLCSFLP